ncbi:formylglycine-generating enzyme family protein [Polyangium aurulentum]|uniref:formylglycine-generating enzyme family protein n=1 Tax=Polyangium aurulentum TaxID=2567896 RepID=UPI0010AE624D|nr:SUMF1/EgtB/PvdO family nonheme iron enzyme [Polyangium aurulentum]UQA54788.1 formylglycine-generating enzyme family protein [Polyangium aurulentum]
MPNSTPSKEPPARSAKMAGRIVVGVAAVVGVCSLSVLGVRALRKADLPLSLLPSALNGLVPRKPTHQWQLVKGKHWQIVAADVAEPMETTDTLENNRGECPSGMVQVKGQMKLDPAPQSVEELQKKTCTKWISREYPERCAEFDRGQWLEISKEFAAKSMNYCMDRFEYPNQRGAYPVLMVNFHEANEMCAEQGKRLCNEEEWTFACEGEEAMPYPYGYVRDTEACVIDHTWRAYNEKAMQQRDGLAVMLELDRLWQGVASGSRPKCKSAFGIYDLTGNIDEWTRSVRSWERPSILKGGYWGTVRTRCRPATRSHNENHTFYQQGFRCCADPGTTLRVHSFTPDPATAPLPRELK